MKMTSMNLTTLIKKSSIKEISKEWWEGVCIMSSHPDLVDKRVVYPKNFEKPVNTDNGECHKIPTYIVAGYHA